MTESLFGHFLVPSDGSEGSIQAAQLAFRMARTFGTRVTLLYVIDRLVLEELTRFSERREPEVRRELEETGRHFLAYLEELARQEGVEIHVAIREGEPHQEIVAVADELSVDLIVMGHVGRRGPRRILIGSVTERVIEFAHCPVLVVKNYARR
ncbi:MAG: universal stress protein [Ardenticatenaceae bacterium]|nr:universal stress protein [Ardenticatenaceae bacterium]HBY96903.1 universal stress protein [Chloroflexota bacterium]